MALRLLIDNGLSPVVADALRAAGHEAAHVRDYGMQRASDDEIIQRATDQDRVIISLDRDFSTLLALGRSTKPSLVLLRGRLSQLHPDVQVQQLVLHLPLVEEQLALGAVVILEAGRVRVRRLPAGSE